MVVTTVSEPRLAQRPTDRTPVGLLVAVPFYKNERLVQRFTDGLMACADDIRDLNARVVFYNDSPDYAALQPALEAAARAARGLVDIVIHRNETNIGWLKTSNLAMQEALLLGSDLILFNSDTVIFPGALAEMARVARLDPMIGFVNPRSNNATITNFPVLDRVRAMAPAEAAAAHSALAHMLPDVTYVPTAVGFALLVRKNILSEFGFFDEAYGGGYNEENDLIMRASRCGYRAVLANHAFVWHEGEQSFEGDARKAVMEAANRAILVSRYPEYDGLIAAWFGGVEHRGEQLLSQLLPDAKGRLRVAFDFSTFAKFHSGTHKAGVQLLRSALKNWGGQYEVAVLCNAEAFEFHRLNELDVERCDPHGPELFAALFRIGQPFDWDASRRLALRAAVVGVFMLDTIALDCSHLYNPQIVNLWHHTLGRSDFVLYNSTFTSQQFELRFPGAAPRLQAVSLHSLDLDDYLPPAPTADTVIDTEISALPNGYILIFGNQYPHKAVGAVANRLAEEFPDTHIVALGVTADGLALAGSPAGVRPELGPRDDKLDTRNNLTGFRVGQLTDAEIDLLQHKAKLIVMPSHYEGFGLPVLSALAMKRPIIARRIPPLLEIHEGLGRPGNMHFFESVSDLIGMLKTPPKWDAAAQPPHLTGDADRAGEDVRRLMTRAIEGASYERIVARFRDIHTLFGIAHMSGRVVPGNAVEFAAQRIANAVEHVLLRVFKFPPIYSAARWAYRVWQTIRR